MSPGLRLAICGSVFFSRQDACELVGNVEYGEQHVLVAKRGTQIDRDNDVGMHGFCDVYG